MSIKLKPLADQVVVVTGASSGIGRETALRFAKEGAKVVAASRSEEALATLVSKIEARGGEAISCRCDVADFEQVQEVARRAEERFGRIDTWVNNAAVTMFAKFWETAPDEFRRVMEINYMGQVHGCLVALPALRRAGGGALIGTSSVESIVSLPLHSAYAASKHAIEGMIDGLRRDVMAEGWPISVTSVKPGTIDTPFFTNALNKMDVEPKGPPPYYHPSVVADCILYAATHPVRDLFAGGGARMMAGNQMLAPGLVDKTMAKVGIPASRTDEPKRNGSGNLYAPTGDDRVSGGLPQPGRRSSLYTWLELHPGAKAVAASGLLAGTFMLARRHTGRGG